MHSRRDFLKTLGVASLGGLALSSCRLFSSDEVELDTDSVMGLSPTKLASNESFWSDVRDAYDLSDDFINIESGYYSPMAQATLDRQVENLRKLNSQASFYMRGDRVKEFKAVKEKLAKLCGCSVDEIAITRNATESLNIVISGLTLDPSDEIVYAYLDYPSMVESIEQRAKRYGTKVKAIRLPRIPNSRKN